MPFINKNQTSLFKTSIALNAATLGLFAFSFLLLALNSEKGFDITDRSFHLLWAGQPENVVGSFTHFGFVTGLLYDLVGQNIAAFRVLGMFILLGLALLFAHSFQLYGKKHFLKYDTNSILVSLVSITLVATLAFYHSWLHVPSYNWLAVAATFITISGLLYFMSLPGRRWAFCLSVLFVSAGGTLAFIAKPTTALVLAFMSIVFILANALNKRGVRFLVCSGMIATILLTLFALYFLGSTAGDSLRLGVDLGSALDSGHTLSSSFTNTVSGFFNFIKWLFQVSFFLIYAALIVGLALFSWLRKYVLYRTNWTILIRTMLLFLILLLFSLLVFHSRFLGSNYQISKILLSVYGLSFLACCYVLFETHSTADARSINHGLLVKAILFSVFFLFGAIAPSFGTNNNIVQHISMSSVFIAVSIFIIIQVISPERLRYFVSSLFGALLAITVMLFLLKAYQEPYRVAGSIGDQNTSVTFANPNHRLDLDSKTARYARDLMENAFEAGWKRGTPLIDMTGLSPGASVILDARIVGTPWIFGRGGPELFADTVFKSVDQNILKNAWILTAPEGRKSLNNEVLRVNNLVFPEQYKMVGEFIFGYRNERQFLWKPKP